MPINHAKAITKYLAQYAEAESKVLAELPGHYDHVLVIPFYRESVAACQRLLDVIEQQGNTLLILVCNRPEDDQDTLWFEQLHTQWPVNGDWQCATLPWLSLCKRQEKSAMLLVDRVLKGRPLPKDEGVGLARKIGADMACALIANGRVRSPWIANSDADTLLPADYFAAIENVAGKQTAAVIYPFRHVAGEVEALLATQVYEFSLHHYVEGLQQAGSPYAYHTLGSTLCIHYNHYAMVRGFPRRSAAEDFYLLNKLAKTGEILSLSGPELLIEARFSDRVPFGTGPAVQRLSQGNQLANYPLYHPATFVYLKVFLRLLRQISQAERGFSYPETFGQTLAGLKQALPNSAAAWFDEGLIGQIAQQLRLEAAVEQCFKQRPQAETRWQQLCEWFDGFKTLKFIHLLRDLRLGNSSLQQWSADMNNCGLRASSQQQQRYDGLAQGLKLSDKMGPTE